MINFRNGIIQRPVKTILYGPEGVGKSTLAGRFPDPLFLDLEDGTARLDVRRIETPGNWEELLSVIQEAADTPGLCRTLVLDTADRAERLCAAHFCGMYHQPNLEAFGDGKGDLCLEEEWKRLLSACDAVIAAGIHVVFIAHARTRKIQYPDGRSYDHWEPRLSQRTGPLLKDWADLMLFLNCQTIYRERNGRERGPVSRRAMFSSHTDGWDAKSRSGLPPEMDLDYARIAHLFEPSDTLEVPPAIQLRRLMKKADITEGQLRQVVAENGRYPRTTPIEHYSAEFITGWCIRYFSQIVSTIREETRHG